jgi:hypothetical protein
MSYCSCGYNPCRCQSSSCSTYVCAGCQIQLDTACSFYHKDNSELTALTNLAITNGATLESILEAIDPYIGQLKFTNFSLPFLRVTYVINSLQQFAQAVDTELNSISTDVATALADSQTPLSVTDSSSIDFIASGVLNHTLTASVKLSALGGNRITQQSDGLHISPQTVSVNYSTKELTISEGNTVSLASLTSAASGFLGNLASDPTAVDGQYWFNTTSSILKMKLNGVVKTIVTA